jgi:hypothetical protein
MTQELAGNGSFRDDNGQEWAIEVRRTGVKRYETEVVAPDGTRYTPDEDMLGEFALVDADGKRHDSALPMNMGELQMAVEKVEDAAWLRQNPAERAEAAKAQEAPAKQSWCDKVKEKLSRNQEAGQQRG